MIASRPEADPADPVMPMPADEHPLTAARLRSMIDELIEISEPARSVDLLVWERAEVSDLKERFVPLLDSLARRVIDRFTVLGEALDGLDAAGTEQPGPSDLETARDTVWLARMELRRRADQLASVARMDGLWPILSLCEGILRKIRHTVASVVERLAPLAGLVPRLEPQDGVALSRRVRVLYATFRARIDAARRLDVDARLRAAAAAVADVVGDGLYHELRVGDRAEFVQLQQRLARWLRGPAGDEAEAGEHLWQDIDGFSTLLRQVNRRSELVALDRAVAGEVLAELRAEERAEEGAEEPAGGAVTEPQRLRLEALSGRDAGIDALLADRSADRAGWIASLESLLYELTGRASMADPN